jgi:hypothetical protein
VGFNDPAPGRTKRSARGLYEGTRHKATRAALLAIGTDVSDGGVRGLMDLVVGTVEYHGGNFLVRRSVGTVEYHAGNFLVRRSVPPSWHI